MFHEFIMTNNIYNYIFICLEVHTSANYFSFCNSSKLTSKQYLQRTFFSESFKFHNLRLKKAIL